MPHRKVRKQCKTFNWRCKIFYLNKNVSARKFVAVCWNGNSTSATILSDTTLKISDGQDTPVRREFVNDYQTEKTSLRGRHIANKSVACPSCGKEKEF